MYEKLGITDYVLQTLGLFTNGFDKKYYVREVQQKLEMNLRTTQLALEKLETLDILRSRTKGKIKLYQLKTINSSNTTWH